MKNSKKEILKGLGWSSLENIFNSGITFVAGLVLSIILSPEEFGVIGIVLILVAIGNTIIDSGFSNALIRATTINQVGLNTVFFFNLITGVTLIGCVYLLASPLSDFLEINELTELLRLMSIIFLLDALILIPRTILIRDLRFKDLSLCSSSGSFFGGLIGIILALKGFGVWSLVSQQITKRIVTTGIIFIVVRWKPTFNISIEQFRYYYKFGSKLLLSSLIDTIYKNVYQFVIGKFYSPLQLGLYNRADQFKSIFSNNLSAIIQRVSYPTLSKVKDNDLLLYQNLKDFNLFSALTSTFLMILLSTIAKSIILIILGLEWAQSIDYLRIICVAGIFHPLHLLNLNLLMVKNRSDLFLKVEIIKKSYAIIPIAVGILYGIKPMLYLFVASSIISLYVNSYFTGKIIGYNFKNQIEDIYIFFLISGTIGLGVMQIENYLSNNLLILILQLLSYVGIHILIFELINQKEYHRLKRFILSLVIKHK